MAIEALLARMTLDEKVGQLFMLGIEGTEPTAASRRLVQTEQLGGVVLFRRNVVAPEQLARLTAGLQEAARATPSGIGLFVALDQEGGIVVRLARGATVFPGNLALGATGDPELARQAGEVTARELAAAGVNMNLAPVLDVNNNPRNPVIGTRSFGSSPEAVARFGQAAIAGLQAGGVAAVAKHFPGHGDTAVDSHLELPLIPHPRARLDAVELAPFRAAIAAGVDGIMTAHVAVPALSGSADRPATLARAVLTDLLREELGYDGLVLTDALEIGAIKGRGGIASAALAAFEAGADLLLIASVAPDDQRASRQALEALRAAVRSGAVSQERLDASVRRILRAKAALGLLPGVDPPSRGRPAPAAPPLDGAALARTIAQRAITVVRDEAGLLPLRVAPGHPNATPVALGTPPAGGVLVVSPRAPTASLVADQDASARLAPALARYTPAVEELLVSGRPTAREIAEAARRASGRGLVVVATYDAWQSPEQPALVRALLATGAPVVVVGLRAPYDLLALPEAPTYVAAYSDRPVALEAVAAVLFGRAPAVGRLPVELPGLYPLGHGLALDGAR